MGRYIEKDDARAEEMFERLIGYSYAVTTYEELHAFTENTGSQIQLTKDPIEFESCQGYLEYEPLMVKDWCEISLETVMQKGRVLDIPPSLFGVPYKKVRVQYTAGSVEIPEDIKAAVEEISQLLANQNASAWNLPLSHETLLTIDFYKKKRERG
jgi:hypothetical protein